MENKDLKLLAKYLAEYIDCEVYKINCGLLPENIETLEDWIEQGIDAFESVHDKSVFLAPKISDSQ